MELIILSSNTEAEFLSKLESAKNYKSTKLKKSLVIDGSTLAFVLGKEEIATSFFKFGCLANSVICCRVSPK